MASVYRDARLVEMAAEWCMEVSKHVHVGWRSHFKTSFKICIYLAYNILTSVEMVTFLPSSVDYHTKDPQKSLKIPLEKWLKSFQLLVSAPVVGIHQQRSVCGLQS